MIYAIYCLATALLITVMIDFGVLLGPGCKADPLVQFVGIMGLVILIASLTMLGR